MTGCVERGVLEGCVLKNGVLERVCYDRMC